MKIKIVAKVSRNQRLEWQCKCGKKSTRLVIFDNPLLDAPYWFCQKCFNKLAQKYSLTEDQKKGIILLNEEQIKEEGK